MTFHSKYHISDDGIYSSQNSYHDDVEYTYHVRFSADDAQKQFNALLESVFNEGEESRSREIGSLLGVGRNR